MRENITILHGAAPDCQARGDADLHEWQNRSSRFETSGPEFGRSSGAGIDRNSHTAEIDRAHISRRLRGPSAQPRVTSRPDTCWAAHESWGVESLRRSDRDAASALYLAAFRSCTACLPALLLASFIGIVRAISQRAYKKTRLSAMLDGPSA